MLELATSIATGRHRYGIYFLLIFMFVGPAALFTDYTWLDAIAWFMLITLGIFILITGVVTLKEAKDSVNWPTVTSELSSASLTFSTGNSGVKSYAPVIKCKFDLDGSTYTGTEYDFSASYTSKDKAQNKIDLVKKMTPLVVYYKPSDPKISVIHPGVHSTHYLRLIIGIAVITVAIFIIANGIQLN